MQHESLLSFLEACYYLSIMKKQKIKAEEKGIYNMETSTGIPAN